MKKVLAILVIAVFLVLAGCGPSEELDEWEAEVEEWEELAEEWEEEGKKYRFIPGAAFSDAVEKEYSRNGVDYNHDEEYQEVTESMLGMRVVVEYKMDFFSMEDKDTIGGGYNDWFFVKFEDINSWNNKLDSMQFKNAVKEAQDWLESYAGETPTRFSFSYTGLDWNCVEMDYAGDIEGLHTEVYCYALYDDRIKVSVSSRSADDAEGYGPPLSNAEMQDRVEEKIDLIDFGVVDSLIEAYSDWDFEEYPLI
jgi:hypothetical protein